MDLRFTKAPKWAEELFIFRANLEAYGLMWNDHSYLSDPKRDAQIEFRKEAVLRHTVRLAQANVEGGAERGALSGPDDASALALMVSDPMAAIRIAATQEPRQFWRRVLESVVGDTNELFSAYIATQLPGGRQNAYSYLAKLCLRKLDGEEPSAAEETYLLLEDFVFGEFEPTFDFVHPADLRSSDPSVLLHDLFDSFRQGLASAVQQIAYKVSHGVPLVRIGTNAQPKYLVEPDSLYVHLSMRGRLWDGPDSISEIPDWLHGLAFDRSHLDAYELMFSGLGESTPEQEQALRTAFRSKIGLSAPEEATAPPALPTILVSSRVVNMMMLAERLCSEGAAGVREALDFTWKMICHDESLKLYELGEGLPYLVGGAAYDLVLADSTLLQSPDDDERLRKYGFDPADAERIRRAFFAISGATDSSNRAIVALPSPAIAPAYLDPAHPRYSAKLAAAIQAWLAMDDERLLRGKRPRTALEDWLADNFVSLRLTNSRDGSMNNTAKEECAKVANWDTRGGAPATPSSDPLSR
jgi:hypothetical protein